MGPLAGVRVVALAGMGPVPFVCMLLADLGAEVLRIDRPAGHPARPNAQTTALDPGRDVVNRGTVGLAVDLKKPDGAELVLRLCERADVFVEGYRPGVAERLGLGPDVVTERSPGLVYARLTGYGQTGPLASTAGHDINYVALSGVLHALAREGERPNPPLNLLGDYAGGGMLAAFGIVAALYEARGSGRGQVVDVAMVDGVALLTAKIHGLRAAGAWNDVPGTNFLDSGAPFYDVYRTADGKHVAIGALEADFYAELLARSGADAAEWPAQDDRRAWPQLRKLLAELFETRTRDEWVRLFDGSDACLSPVLTFDEAAEHPHNAARGTYAHVDGVLHPAPAPRFSRTPVGVGGVGGLDGAGERDPVDVLTGWDVDQGHLDTLRRSGAVQRS